MKVRIGIGFGRAVLEPEELAAVGRQILVSGFDSIWLSEVLASGGLDPFVALAYLAAAVPGLKLGTTMLLPGRNPLRLAKSLATLDRCCDGNLLVTFVPGLTEGAERAAVGVAPAHRGAAIEELLPLVRRLLDGERVEYSGPAGPVIGVTCAPLPRQRPLEFWLGGMAPAALERCGRIGDGWLPSSCTPEEARSGRAVVEAAAAAVGRTIDPDHFGVSLAYARAPFTDEERHLLERGLRGRAPEAVIPVGREALRRAIEGFTEVGFSKFVLRPVAPPRSILEEIERLADDVADLQT